MFLVLSLAFAADVEIIPSSTGGPSNCIPFGKPYKNSSQYQGFVYQNIPAFELYPGDTIAFDLGAENDTDITVDIALATATSNGSSEQDSDGFTTVVSSGTPADPNGNTVHGDYELEYTVDTPFSFAGGGLIMRFQGKGAFASDTTCTQVLVITTHLDASGYFVGRFYKDTDGVYTWDGTDPWELGGFQITYAAWYADSDGDGYGDPSVSGSHGASGYVSDNTDCDDTDDTIYPGASELCDGQANDCNGAIGSDEVDSDGDSYVVCTLDSGGWDGSGTVIGGDDCDDGEATVHPTAAELCDGQDNDCINGIPSDETDDDGDGWVECVEDSGGWDGSAISGFEDCDDTDPDSWPGADEYCDGHDDDCDGDIDEDDSLDAPAWYADSDGDSYGNANASNVTCYELSGWVLDDTDCDDTNADAYPGAEEVPYDAIDQDCDGVDLCDVDGDGFDYDGAECFGEDCDDQDHAINPKAEETWYDGVDQDCDEASDYDADGDGYDSASYHGEDCDDDDPDTYPGAPDEPGDGIITDCDGADEYDADGDGFDGADYGGSDCDDANSGINPGADEVWYDGVDQDCDGNDDDQDGDGWAVDEDCDDSDPQRFENCGGDSGLVGDTGLGGSGCACGKSSTAPAPASLILALLGLLVGLRRR